VEWIDLTDKRIQWQSLLTMVFKQLDLFDQLKNYQLPPPPPPKTLLLELVTNEVSNIHISSTALVNIYLKLL
jgi:hypothetical protein